MATTNTTALAPQAIVTELLKQPVQAAPRPLHRPVIERHVATLERQAPDTVERARQAGADIEYLGINPLFADARLYQGPGTDWVLAPADNTKDAVVPWRERQTIQRLAASDVDFPLIYIAHEIPKETTRDIWPEENRTGYLALNRGTAQQLAGPAPAPAGAVELSHRLGHRTTQVLRGVTRTSQTAGIAAAGVIAAPVALVGAALASLATLDPIVLGAVPALRSEPGEPAAWYVLARWDW